LANFLQPCQAASARCPQDWLFESIIFAHNSRCSAAGAVVALHGWNTTVPQRNLTTGDESEEAGMI